MSIDVLVVGGGPSGSALALGLARAGLQVCVADAQSVGPSLPESGHDLRVSAINRASQAFLADLGVWQRLPAERLAGFDAMRVWDAAGSGAISFDAASIGASLLGHIVENACLQQALDAALEARPNVRRLRGARLQTLQVAQTEVIARLEHESLRARLVVGADGARSTVRELSGIEARVDSYEQSAVVCNLRMRDGHQDTAWQRFLPGGPLAVLPLPGAFASIVWTTTPAHAAELLALDAGSFNAAVAAAFDHRLGDVVWSGPRASFALFRVQAQRYVSARIMLIGDAAHTIHPLAGQGLNLGMMDAAVATEVLAETHARGRDPGGRAALRRYERWRKSHNLAVQSSMDGLRWLFGHDGRWVGLARNAGLHAVHASGPVKRQLARLASGLAGDLPRSALSEHLAPGTGHR